MVVASCAHCSGRLRLWLFHECRLRFDCLMPFTAASIISTCHTQQATAKLANLYQGFHLIWQTSIFPEHHQRTNSIRVLYHYHRSQTTQLLFGIIQSPSTSTALFGTIIPCHKRMSNPATNHHYGKISKETRLRGQMPRRQDTFDS